MLRDDAVIEIQERLKFRTDRSAEIIRRMQHVQRLLELGRTLPWFLVEEDAPLSLLAGTSDVNLPDEFIREYEYGRGMRYQPEAGATPVFVPKMNIDELRALWTEAEPGFPQGYAIQTSVLKFLPVAAEGVTLRFDYYKKALVLTSNIENVWLKYAPDIIIGNAGASFAKTLDNKSAMAECTELASIAIQAVFNETIMRQTANRAFILGRNT